MRRAALTALLCALALGASAAPAQAAFGLNEFDVFFQKEQGSAAAATAAGSHPHSMRTSFGINFTGVDTEAQPDGEIKDADFTQIPGLAGNPTATPLCSSSDFLAGSTGGCPAQTKLGETTVEIDQPATFESGEVFNLIPPPGSAARLGFLVVGVPVVIDVTVEPDPPYRLLAKLRNTRQVVKVFSASLTLFGTPPNAPGEVPFLTLPTACAGPQLTDYEALSWLGETDSGFAPTHDSAGNPEGFSECERLSFDPRVSAQPTTESASSASGLSFELSFDQKGLSDAESRSQSALREAVITLPEGMTANPSIAAGLGVCEPGDLDEETLAADPGSGCPSASKIGTVAVTTPLLEAPVPGAVHIAQPDDPATSAPGAENPFDSLLALYIVLKDPARGILLKLPAEVSPDPQTGQLITTVTDAPQLPFSRFTFRFREGQRAPLITPPRCGDYAVEAELTPWARPGQSSAERAAFEISRGPGGGPCPAGAPPFDPGFEAGSANNAAAAHSPFLMRITRQDGHQDLTKLAALLPPGVTGRLAGIPRCPDALIALARAKSAAAELAAPSCPPASAIGHTLAAAGVGEALTYVSGALYLAGPYNGAPLSVAAITPAKAGPFDAGTVVVRVALRVDPRTAQVAVDGAASDPIPHILQGIPLNVRELRVSSSRPGFTLNPTSCDPSQTAATLWGGFLDVLDPADDLPLPRFARYQAAGCEALGFSPRLKLRLKGGTRRGAFPALRAVYVPRPGEANLARLALRFPRSAFIEQGHFRTICTRVAFAAPPGHGAHCPKGSIYGRARVFTPLLDEPLQGPVFLRSSDNNLPDAVFALKGLLDFEVTVRIDSVRGGLRATVSSAPDVPVSRAVVNMAGGQRGLFVNSRDLCAKPSRANLRLAAHNGAARNANPLVVALRCKAKRDARRSAHRRR